MLPHARDESKSLIRALVDEAEVKPSVNGHNGNRAQQPSSCPELPEGARIDPALGKGAGAWLETYTDYARKVSPMTPAPAHESAALALGSTAIARRLCVRMPYGTVYPNLFIVWVYPSTLWRKTTALNVARKRARRSFPHLLAPQDTTPEALLADLAGMEPTNFDKLGLSEQALWREEAKFAAQRCWMLDEMSGLLASAGKDYGQGLIEALLRLYDCDPRFVQSRRTWGRLVVKSAYLTLIGASTPTVLASHLTSGQLWSNGFWPRFAILTPEESYPAWIEATDAEEPPSLAAGLEALYSRLPEPDDSAFPEARSVALGTGVYEAWKRYNKAVAYDLLIPGTLDERLWAAYGRLPTHTLKVATILAAFDWNGTGGPMVELPHFARALSIVEGWRASLHRALDLAGSGTFDQLRLRILRQLGRFEPDGASMRDLTRSMKDLSPDDLKDALRQIIETGDAEELATQSGPKGGRPTVRYRLTRE